MFDEVLRKMRVSQYVRAIVLKSAQGLRVDNILSLYVYGLLRDFS